ncbi:hypothetical protein [Microbacterium sp. NPDC076895]|uniref:hypothetical protein n=1 Tax=Microbacterium sp. NPDC076895 TaxID=3154957 RepID=UPI00341C3017
MQRTVLREREQQAKVPATLLVVRAYATPPTVPVTVRAIARDGADVPRPPVPPPPGAIIVGLDHLDGVTLRVDAEHVFPPATTVRLVAEAGTTAVEIGPIATAGLSSEEIATLRVENGQLIVRVAAGDGEIVALSELGERARAEAVDIIDASRLAASERIETHLVVDGSASFRALGNASVRNIADVMAGICSVVGDGDVRVVISGRDNARPSVSRPDALCETVITALTATPRSSGAGLSNRELYPAIARSGATSWVVTDDVPSDLTMLAQRASGAGHKAHLVIFGDISLAPGPAVGGIPATFIDLATWGTEVTPPDTAVAEVVASLLRGISPDTDTRTGKAPR